MAFDKQVTAELGDRKFAPGTIPGQYVVTAVVAGSLDAVYQDVQDEGDNSEGWLWTDTHVFISVPLPAAGVYRIDLYRNDQAGNPLVDVDGTPAHYAVEVEVTEPELVTIRVPISLALVG